MKTVLKTFLIMIVCGSLAACLHSLYKTGSRPDKLWLHRCNSLEKWNEKRQSYPNIEIDLVFRDKNTFDVTHDIDKTYNLSLEDFFQAANKQTNKQTQAKMWLDIKNLGDNNTRQAIDRLNRLVTDYDINRNHLIIESRDTSALRQFNDEGYYTSYYVDFPKPSSLDDTQLAQHIATLRLIVDSDCSDAISFPGWWYTTIKQHLKRDIDLLTWRHRTTQFEFFLDPLSYRMLDDNQLKVILIKDKGSYHR